MEILHKRMGMRRTVHTHALAAQVGDLHRKFPHLSDKGRGVISWALIRRLSASRAPPAANPLTNAPHPPSRRFGVVPLGIVQQPFHVGALMYQPAMPGVQIKFTYGIVGVLCYGVGVVL